jgi:hypothetical protein
MQTMCNLSQMFAPVRYWNSKSDALHTAWRRCDRKIAIGARTFPAGGILFSPKLTALPKQSAEKEDELKCFYMQQTRIA